MARSQERTISSALSIKPTLSNPVGVCVLAYAKEVSWSFSLIVFSCSVTKHDDVAGLTFQWTHKAFTMMYSAYSLHKQSKRK